MKQVFTQWLARMQASWEDDLDVSGGRQRAAWWSWCLLAAGALMLMMAVDHVDGLHQQTQEATDQAKRLGRADRQMRMQRALALQQSAPSAASTPGASATSNVQSTDAPALQGPAVVPATRMVRLLAYPWAAHLALVDAQASSQQVVLTSMTVVLDAADTSAKALGQGSVRWRLQAAVKDDASALALARRLPHGELLSRELTNAPFTTRAGTYPLKVFLQMWPAVGSVGPVGSMAMVPTASKEMP